MRRVTTQPRGRAQGSAARGRGLSLTLARKRVDSSREEIDDLLTPSCEAGKGA
jgi:hypothetical protein